MNQVSCRNREPRSKSASNLLERLVDDIIHRLKPHLSKEQMRLLSLDTDPTDGILEWRYHGLCEETLEIVRRHVVAAVAGFKRASFAPGSRNVIHLITPTRD